MLDVLELGECWLDRLVDDPQGLAHRPDVGRGHEALFIESKRHVGHSAGAWAHDWS